MFYPEDHDSKTRAVRPDPGDNVRFSMLARLQALVDRYGGCLMPDGHGAEFRLAVRERAAEVWGAVNAPRPARRRERYPTPDLDAPSEAAEVRLVEMFLRSVEALAGARNPIRTRANLAAKIGCLEEREGAPAIHWAITPTWGECSALSEAAAGIYDPDVTTTHYVPTEGSL